MKKKKKVATIAVVVVALVAVLVWSLAGGKGKQSVSFVTEAVERATLSTSVTATGTIEAVTEVEVGTQVSGIISKIYVDYNSEVTKGQIIAELDKTNLESELKSARSNLASAKSSLDYQRINLQRMQTLYDKGLISADEFEQARLAYDQALATYETRQEAVKTAETNLGYAIITSPIDGVILSRDVEEGQTVAASYSTPTLFTIAQDLTDMRVIANVDEADIGEVREGQRVEFTVDAYPGLTFEGSITQVRQEGTTEDNVVTYEVVISAPNDELKLKPGLTANVTIYTMEQADVLSVPTKALRFEPLPETVGADQQIVDCDAEHKLWLHEGTTFTAVPVEVGMSDATRTEIVSGIDEGTRVVAEVVAGQEAAATGSTERSPFAPGPRRNNNNSKK